ncbi:MAG TPA: branched-chain amino acid ABC transporter permease, partial [Opitutus sp.]|nr:branched-chain amino acid ABC transporter permease [Opitutus sp.]
MTEFLQQLLNGLSLGAIYALIALGYTMVYGVLRFINFAHSDVFMVGAFIGYYAGRIIPENTIWGGFTVLLLAMTGCALLGMRIERTAYRPLREPTEFNLVTILGALGAGALAIFLTRGLASLEFGLPLRIVICWASAEVAALLLARTGWKIVLQRTQGGAPTLNVLITAIGVSLLLEYSGQLIFGAAPRTFPSVFPSMNFQLGKLTISSNQLFVI